MISRLLSATPSDRTAHGASEMRTLRQFGARIRPRQLALPGAPGRPESLFAHEMLTVAEAAEFLRISPSTLNWWRKRGQRCGPRYIKVHAHRILYRACDLENFLESRTVDPGERP